MIASIVLSILLFQTNIISWPVSDHFPYRGYGDFNGIAEFHTGLDFRASQIEEVSVPCPGQEHYVVYVYNQASIHNMIVVLSPGPNPSRTGWAYEHLDYSSHPADIPSQGDVLPATTQTLTTCMPGSANEPQHVHLALYDGWWLNPYPHSTKFHLVQDSPYNVFMDFGPSVMKYDYPKFTSVENYTGGETGIVFMPDESTLNPLSRDDIYGKVDIRKG